MEGAPSLIAIFGRFLRFGLLAWGGPVAQIAMVKRELVEEERWLDPPRFNRLLAVYQVLPGPEAHELCVHFGMMKGGRLGGVAAGLGFMLPGLLLILLLSWAYDRIDLSAQPWPAILLGIQIAVVALIVRAVHRIGEHALHDLSLWLVAGLAAAAALLETPFWISLPAAGFSYLLARDRRPFAAAAVVALAAALAVALHGPGAGNAAGPSAAIEGDVAAPLLFLSGLKAGLLTFGGAYTAIPFIRDDTVGRGWVSDAQFLDGLALSGIIPAPLIIFGTFVGYQAGGLDGALAMTAGIFLPAFAFTLIFFDRLEAVVEDSGLHRVLEGVAAAVVGLVAATLIELAAGLARSTPSLPAAALILAASLTILYAWSSRYVVLALMPVAAIAGWAAFG